MKKKKDSIISLNKVELQKQLKRESSTLKRLKRELKIEASLEKVRSRTMAMQHSDELKGAAALLFQQVKALGAPAYSCGYNIWEKNAKEFTSWMSTQDGSDFNPALRIPLTEDANFIRFNESRQRGEQFYVIEMRGERMQEHYQYLKTMPVFREYFEYAEKAGFDQPDTQIHHLANFSHGNLLFITLKPCPKFHDVFKRFAAVFDQTYTRFLDLQRAESQAREAQIEAALERVRGRSMGMQKSEELKEVIQIVYEQFVHLKIYIEHTGFVMDYKAREDMNIWLADQHGAPSQVTIPYFDSVYWNRFNEAKEKGMDFFATHLTFEEKNRFYQKLFEYVPGLPEEAKEFYFSCPGLAISTVLLENVCLYIENFSGISYSDEENATLMRFGKVFQQTYTRFLDLQKAEAQAREAKIEAALERVRSRSMGMKKSEELREVIQVIYEQFIQLGFNIDSAGFAMDYLESDDFNFWFADSNSSFPNKVHIPYFDHPQFNRFKDAKERGLDFYISNLTFEEKIEFIDHVFRYSPPVSREIKEVFYNTPGYMSSHVLLKNVGLYILNYTDIPFSDVENAILIRFGKVFEQTYIRFNDLKQAEAQAMEAVKRASVDRVRAEIASMRTTDDLERITPLVWSELNAIGVPFTRCGVFIMDEQQQQVNSFLSTPEGKAILAFRLPFNAHPELAAIISHWNGKQMYKPHWDEEALMNWTRSLVEQGEIISGERYLAENRPNSLYLHFLPFLQGMLYVGNTASLSDEHLQLVQALAEAFSTAYARYEDFNKLESAKEQIEKTLVDLKQAQSQLVQAEKMASLGELTAGIAHEIQNPLNFVNNFSEVNRELISEMKEELVNGNLEDVREIANQIGENEEKITHHGKRADAIVKGMLQHSQSGSGKKEPTDLNAMADEYLRLAYHGLRAKDKTFNATMQTDYDASIGQVNIIPQDMGRVLLNLYNNAFYVVNEKKKEAHAGYEPTVSVSTSRIDGKVEIRVKDNGNGIPQKVIDKIFQPFFTTKPTGQGTGLGLSLSYDVVKAHGGEIKVDTREGEFTEFTIRLPLSIS